MTRLYITTDADITESDLDALQYMMELVFHTREVNLCVLNRYVSDDDLAEAVALINKRIETNNIKRILRES